MNSIKNGIKLLVFPFVFLFGFILFLFTKKTSNLAYVSFRYLFVLTDGRINNMMSSMVSLVSKPMLQSGTGVLGEMDKSKIDSICSQLSSKGYYQFDKMLSEAQVQELLKVAHSELTRYIDVEKKGVVYADERVLFNPESPISPRYQFDSKEIVQHASIQKLLFDDSLHSVASKYLKCQPILDIAAMWWSVPFKNKGTSQAAQMYHFDMDRFKFLKFFFYLTDVHSENGPHCYIEGSNVSIDKRIRKDMRISDEELLTYYSSDNFKEFTGKKGTILAVDTRGLHKGKPLTFDNRLLFQIQFSNSLFGSQYTSLKIDEPNKIYIEKMNKNMRTYQLVK